MSFIPFGTPERTSTRNGNEALLIQMIMSSAGSTITRQPSSDGVKYTVLGTLKGKEGRVAVNISLGQMNTQGRLTIKDAEGNLVPLSNLDAITETKPVLDRDNNPIEGWERLIGVTAHVELTGEQEEFIAVKSANGVAVYTHLDSAPKLTVDTFNSLFSQASTSVLDEASA